jgi:hypothetical protein
MMTEKRSSLKIEFVDNGGDTHIFYNDEIQEDNVEFIGRSFARFLKSLGWSEGNFEDAVDTVDSCW